MVNDKAAIRVAQAMILVSTLLGLVLGSSEDATAQSSIEIVDQHQDYRFGEWLLFEAKFESTAPLVDAHIVLHIEGIEELFSFEAELDDHGGFFALVSLPDMLEPPAFREIEFWYLVGAEDGSIFESGGHSFLYDDNRFEWRQISEQGLTVNWYAGDQEFGEAILGAAREAVRSVQRVIPIAGPERVDFYIYADQAALLETMRSAGYSWAAGHSDLSQERIFLAISPSPEQSLEIERQVPHEMAHIMLHRALGAEAYEQLPRWLDEGIASNAELYSDPLAPQLLELAHAEGSLPSIFALCDSFPQDSQAARLAYATAGSFVAYLRDEYQAQGMSVIVDAYAYDDNCMFALEDLLGKNLLQLELDWQANRFSNENALSQIAWQPILLVVLVAVLVFWMRKEPSNG